jgi:hypothetical protein
VVSRHLRYLTTANTTDTAVRTNILGMGQTSILGDDFGFSNVGAFGSEISTPNLDQLAKEGKILTNYHTAATCSPARAAILRLIKKG